MQLFYLSFGAFFEHLFLRETGRKRGDDIRQRDTSGNRTLGPVASPELLYMGGHAQPGELPGQPMKAISNQSA